MSEIFQEGKFTNAQGVVMERVRDVETVKKVFKINPLFKDFADELAGYIAESGALIRVTGTNEQLKELQEIIEQKE